MNQFTLMIARTVVGKNWVFTINNFNESDEIAVTLLKDREEVYRIIAEKEHTDGEGTPHIQGYVSFTSATTREHVHDLLGGRAFVEKARGGWRQNWAYCSKENKVFVEKKGEGVEERISASVTEEALEAMKHMDPFQFQDTYPNIWFYHRSKVLNTMMDEAMKQMKDWNGNLKEKNFWIYGEPGLGKTKWATSIYPAINQYKKNSNKWWCGYSIIMHKIVIIEDMDPTRANILTQFIKIWGDRYPFIGEQKNRSVMVQPGKFFLVITANYSIDECFMNQQDRDAIHRRFNEIRFCHENRAIVSNLMPDKNILE